MALPWHLLSNWKKWSIVFSCIEKALGIYSNYEIILLAWDCNVEEDEPCLRALFYKQSRHLF